VTYLSAARGDETVVEARLVRKGGRLAVVEAEVRDAGAGVLNAKLFVSWTLERGASEGDDSGR
jgi:acyl-coenzyme A thioesterase PaaI-like protein